MLKDRTKRCGSLCEESVVQVLAVLTRVLSVLPETADAVEESNYASKTDGVSLDLDLIPGILRSSARALRTRTA